MMVEIFQVLRSFGVRGGVKIRPYADGLSSYKKVYDSAGKEYSLRLSKRDPSVVFFEEIADRNTADTLRGQVFYVNRKDLKPIPSDQFYVCDLIGKAVAVENSDLHCEIVSFQNYGAGDLVELSFENKTFLVPFTKQNFPTSELVISRSAFEGFIKNVAG